MRATSLSAVMPRLQYFWNTRLIYLVIFEHKIVKPNVSCNLFKPQTKLYNILNYITLQLFILECWGGVHESHTCSVVCWYGSRYFYDITTCLQSCDIDDAYTHKINFIQRYFFGQFPAFLWMTFLGTFDGFSVGATINNTKHLHNDSTTLLPLSKQAMENCFLPCICISCRGTARKWRNMQTS